MAGSGNLKFEAFTKSCGTAGEWICWFSNAMEIAEGSGGTAWGWRWNELATADPTRNGEGALEGAVGRIRRQLPCDNSVDDAEFRRARNGKKTNKLRGWRFGDLTDLTDSVANC